MKEVYIIIDKKTGKFKTGRKYDSWTEDSSKARTYNRITDAKNSVRSGEMFDTNYSLVPCQIVPAKPNYKVIPIKPEADIFADHEVRIYDNKELAELYVDTCAHRRFISKDYFQVVETYEGVTHKDEVFTSAHKRPSWTEYFLGLAIIISKRSHDIHTQHGCILVDRISHHILATGYNGFPRGMNDTSLPTNRPDPTKPEADDKYAWMLHSEFNACCNMDCKADKNTVAYVTGECCFPCLTHMWQKGITHVIQRNAYGSKHLIDDKSRKRRETLLAQTKMRVESADVNLTWLREATANL
jgi:dCMP deaminase